MLPGDYDPFYFRFQCNDDYDSKRLLLLLLLIFNGWKFSRGVLKKK